MAEVMRSHSNRQSESLIGSRKYEEVKEMVEWIDMVTTLTKDIAESLGSLCGKLHGMSYWQEKLGSLERFNVNAEMIKQLQSISLQDVSLANPSSPKESDLHQTSWFSPKNLSPSPAKSDVGSAIFSNHQDEIDNARRAYSQYLECLRQVLVLIEQRVDNVKQHFEQRLVSQYAKFCDSLEPMKRSIKSYLSATILSNARRSDTDIAVRGPHDVKISTLFESIDVPTSSAAIGCTWLHKRTLMSDVQEFIKNARVLHSSLQDVARESYSLSHWASLEKRKLNDSFVINHRAYAKYLYDSEMEFISQLDTGEIHDHQIIPPTYSVPVVLDSITISKATMMTELEALEQNADGFSALYRILDIPIPTCEYTGVSSTMVINRTEGFWTKTNPSMEIPVGQPLLVQITWDRYIHFFRSHRDAQPIKSIYALDMQPMVKDNPDGGNEIIELQPTPNAEDTSFLKSAFRRPNSRLSPFRFEFSYPEENKYWKRLIRYASLEQDVAFITFSMSMQSRNFTCSDVIQTTKSVLAAEECENQDIKCLEIIHTA